MNKKQLRKKLALMLANLKKKRPYYCEVEWLKTDGYSYIDTGVSGDNDNLKFDIYFSTTTTDLYSPIMGNAAEESQNNWGIIKGSNNCLGYANTRRSTGLNFTAYKTDDTLNHIIFYRQGNSCIMNVNGTTASQNALDGTYNNANICIGRAGPTRTPPASRECKHYRFMIYDNGVLVCDMIPVLDWNMTPCMYDKVSGQLFYNAGAGDFSYGREIHYVEYLESTGTQYIDTGISTWDNTIEYEISLGIRQQSGTRTYFGCYDTWGDGGKIVPSVNTFVTNYRMQSNFNTGFSSDSGTIIGIQNGQNGILSLMGDTLSWSEGTSLEFDRGESFTKNIPIMLFSTYYSGGAKEFASFPLYYAKFWLGGVLVRDYLPAIDENGVGFMFDRASHTIYDNDGTGAFKYPAREVEYIESDGNQYIDTGVVLSSTDKVEASLEYTGEPTQGSSYVFGTYGSSKNFGINCALKTTPKYWYGVWYNQGTLTSSSIFSDLNTRYDIQVSSNGMYINDNLLTTVSGTFTGSVSAYLFWAHGTGQPKSLMKLYSCKMWQSDVLVRDFIPCYKDGVLGVLDKVNDVFYDNDGTGTFTGGPVKEDEYE